MPLLVWTIITVLTFIILIAGCRKSRLRFLVTPGTRFATVIALLWFTHLGILWHLVRCLINLSNSELHLSRGEGIQLWRDVTVACSEMGLLSTLFVIWSSTLLLVFFTRHAILQNHPVQPNLLPRLESE